MSASSSIGVWVAIFMAIAASLFVIFIGRRGK